MKLFAVLTASVISAGASLLVMSPASAHTPAISADCSGVHVGATAYDAGMANRWSVTIGGVTQSGTFGSSLNQTFPVPQDGATTAWSAYVEAADGSYHGERSGSVGPCGTPSDACVDLPGNQPVGTPCTPPPDVTRADAKALDGCAVAFGGTTYGAGALTYDEQFTDTYVFNGATNAWDLVTDTTPTIANVVFTPWTTQEQVAADCVEMPAQPPAVHESHSSEEVDCDSDTVVTTTVSTTTPFVYDDATNTWVPGEPVTHTTTSESPASPQECPESGVSPSDIHVQAASSTSAPDDSSTSLQVPTTIAAGLSATPEAPAAAPAGAAPVSAAPAAAAQGDPGQTPALLLLVVGAGLVGTALLRVRRG
ncbi:hypothetical protein [Nocardioides sp.]|uniref:hypothetical protein n=1 Tax=Nocardioides sp. TaxID=35761 RepID=UPI0025E40882|nr:hypothetical protein [Nocardioides sp.]